MANIICQIFFLFFSLSLTITSNIYYLLNLNYRQFTERRGECAVRGREVFGLGGYDRWLSAISVSVAFGNSLDLRHRRRSRQQQCLRRHRLPPQHLPRSHQVSFFLFFPFEQINSLLCQRVETEIERARQFLFMSF